jgi:hypothetical protein
MVTKKRALKVLWSRKLLLDNMKSPPAFGGKTAWAGGTSIQVQLNLQITMPQFL